MAETYTAGMWVAKEGEEDQFVEAWRAFVEWAADSQENAGTFRLTREVKDPRRFFSFAPWPGIEPIQAWKQSPEFRERIGRVKQHTDDFTAWELELVTAVGEPAAAAKS